MAGSLPSDLIIRECDVFHRYLMGAAAPEDVLTAYRRAHEVGGVEARGVAEPLDRALLGVARNGPAWTRIVDAYAAVFAKSSLLRRKVVLLLAILESRGSSSEALDTAMPGSRLVWTAQVALCAALTLCRIAVAALVVQPLGLWYRFIHTSSRP
jgi:hypothetical protein